MLCQCPLSTMMRSHSFTETRSYHCLNNSAIITKTLIITYQLFIRCIIWIKMWLRLFSRQHMFICVSALSPTLWWSWVRVQVVTLVCWWSPVLLHHNTATAHPGHSCSQHTHLISIIVTSDDTITPQHCVTWCGAYWLVGVSLTLPLLPLYQQSLVWSCFLLSVVNRNQQDAGTTRDI